MPQYYRSFSETKQQYQEILTQAQQELYVILGQVRMPFACTSCDTHPTEGDASWFQPLPPQCGYRGWQQSALNYLEQELGRTILEQLQQIDAYKNRISCHMCGVCCRLASSEHSYETLQQQALAGDAFAQQFTSIFLPYDSRQTAEAKFPEVVQAVLTEAGEAPGEEQIYFYHCPYIGEDNRCTVYGTEKRPELCASYPETPLSFVYQNCAWKPWKDETHQDTLKAHALLALAQSIAAQLQHALRN